MATQTLEFSAGTGLTLSCKLFAFGSDTVVDTQTATEKTNDVNRYSVSFTDVPAGAYRLNAFVGSVGGFANEVYDLELSTATFYPRSETFSNITQALSLNIIGSIERSIDDNKAITFSWPVSGATITAERSIDNGSYSSVTGSISFLRTESGKHYYTLAYNSADRSNEEASIRYKLNDGTYTKYFNLRIVPSVDLTAVTKNTNLIPALF